MHLCVTADQDRAQYIIHGGDDQAGPERQTDPVSDFAGCEQINYSRYQNQARANPGDDRRDGYYCGVAPV